jgi:glycine cleavage system H protein
MAFYFTRDHEWISVNATVDDVTATVGITDYAQAQLGDVVFVEVPPVGTMVDKGKEAAVVESVKAASDVYAPVSGEVVGANAALEADPSLVNTAPETDGWFFKVKLSDAGQLDGLMDGDSYKVYCEGL